MDQERPVGRDLIGEFLRASVASELKRQRQTWTIMAVVFTVITTLAVTASWQRCSI